MGEGFFSRFKDSVRARRTHSKRWGTIVPLLLSCTLMSACSYYYYTVEERAGTEKRLTVPMGYVQFAATQIYAGESCLESEDFIEYDSEDAEIALTASVYVTDTVSPDRAFRIVVDSVDAMLDGGAQTGIQSPPVSKYGQYGLVRGASICPIWIPRDYKRDFVLRFRLRVYGEATGELLMTETIAVTIVYHRERYFIFDAPYG